MDDAQAARLFGDRVRRKRMMVGLNQRQLAEKLGVPATHLSRLEGGYILSVGIGEFLRLVEALRTSPDYLLGLSDDPGEIPAKDTCFAVAQRRHGTAAPACRHRQPYHTHNAPRRDIVMPILAKTTPATHADAASPSSLYRRPRPKLHQRPTPTLTTMPRIRAFLRTRQSQLDAGEGVYIVHRVEVGRLRLFLDQVKLAMPQARCFYMLSP